MRLSEIYISKHGAPKNTKQNPIAASHLHQWKEGGQLNKLNIDDLCDSPSTSSQDISGGGEAITLHCYLRATPSPILICPDGPSIADDSHGNLEAYGPVWSMERFSERSVWRVHLMWSDTEANVGVQQWSR